MNAVTARETETRPAETRSATAPQPAQRRSAVQPDADILTSPEGIELRIDVPGVAEKDIDIRLEKNLLTVKATREAPSTENYRTWIAESGAHDYECAYRLGFQADPEKIIARCKHGVLTILVPRAEADQPKKIAVTSD